MSLIETGVLNSHHVPGNDDHLLQKWLILEKRQTEPEPTIYTLTLDDITRFHYSNEGYPPRSQMANHIRYLHTLLPDNITYFLDTKSIHPHISERARSSQDVLSLMTPDNLKNVRPSSLECNLLMKGSSDAKLCLFMHPDQDIISVRNSLIEGLNHARRDGKAVKPKANNTNIKRWIYEFKNPDDVISVESLGIDANQVTKRQPYIIIEEDREGFGYPKLSIKIAVRTENDSPTVHSFSLYRSLFEIEIKSVHIATTRENVLASSDNIRTPRWRFSHEDPNPSADISDSLLSALRKPELRYELYQHPDFKYMTLLRQKENRHTYPYYFLEMLMTASTLINRAVIHDPKEFKVVPVFDEKSQERFRERTQFFASDIQGEYSNEWKGKIRFPYSSYDYLLYKLIWEGKDIWPNLQQFTYTMIDSLKKNPEVFWESFYELGLNNILPYFIKHQRENISTITQRLQKSDLRTLAEAFDLLPDLSPYYNFSDKRGNRQKDGYYMQVLYALTLYALRKGKCGIASLVEKEGKILSARYNGKRVTEHAEILALEDAEKYLPTLPNGKHDFTGCANFTTVLHCPGCAGFALEDAPSLSRIIYAVLSKMSAQQLLQTRAFPHVYPTNPLISGNGVLEDQFLQLYHQLAKFDRTYEDMFRK